MVKVKRIVLDVLKPHHPNGLEFSTELAGSVPGARVELTVAEVDEKTESVILVIEGDNLDYEILTRTIHGMGGSVHSIDEVMVESTDEQDA